MPCPSIPYEILLGPYLAQRTPPYPVRRMLSRWILALTVRLLRWLIARWIALGVLFYACVTAQNESESLRRYERPVITLFNVPLTCLDLLRFYLS